MSSGREAALEALTACRRLDYKLHALIYRRPVWHPIHKQNLISSQPQHVPDKWLQLVKALGTKGTQVKIQQCSLTTLFQLVTLPVEFDASARALATIEGTALLDDGERKGAKKRTFTGPYPRAY